MKVSSTFVLCCYNNSTTQQVIIYVNRVFTEQLACVIILFRFMLCIVRARSDAHSVSALHTVTC
jgi:hypothetical protein